LFNTAKPAAIGIAGAGSPNKPSVALISNDQSKRCAYCESSLPHDFVTDHFHPHTLPSCKANALADGDSWSLTWSNLFAVCDAGSPLPLSSKGCSAAKGDFDICVVAYRPTEIPRDAFEVDLETGALVVTDKKDEKLVTTVSALGLDRQSIQRKRLDLVETITELQTLGFSLNDLRTEYGNPEEPFVTTLRTLLGPFY
jgi:hypothetical protein